MKYRQETRAERDWDGEFDTYRSATFRDAQGRRCITQRDFAQAREDGAFPVRYYWNRSET
jgi:hypothetical protein